MMSKRQRMIAVIIIVLLVVSMVFVPLLSYLI